MKKQLLLLLCFLTLGSITAQVKLSKDYSYSISIPYKVFDGDKYYFNHDGHIVTFKIFKKKILTQKFEVEGLKEVTRTEYSISDLFPKNWVLEGVSQIEDNVYVYYSSWDGGKNKNERLFAKKISFETGKFVEGFDKKIVSTEGKVAGITIKKGGTYSFNIQVVDKFDIIKIDGSPNFLVKYRRKPKTKSDKRNFDVIGMEVFDKDLNKIWGSEFKMPYTERQMNLLDYSIDPEGNIYALIKKFHDDSNKDRKKKVINYHLELFKYDKNSKALTTRKINIGDKYISDIGLYINENKEIYCAGYYDNGNSNSGVDGVFVFKTDNLDNITDKNFYEIPVEILNQYVKKKTKNKNNRKDKKGKADYKSLELRKLFFHEDGSITVIGEQYYLKVRTSTSSKGTVRTTYTYHYNDILVSKITPSGDLDWMRKIPKRQKGSRGLGGMSFTHFFTNNSHYLLYLDNVKNAKLPMDKVPALHSDKMGGYLTACKINNVTGDVSKGSIFNSRRLKGGMAAHQFDTYRIVQTNDDEFVVEVYKKKKQDILIKVKIKEEEEEVQSKL